MRKFTVFFEQRNRTNFQVLAKDKKEAYQKGCKLYQKNMTTPDGEVQDGWLVESDGEDK